MRVLIEWFSGCVTARVTDTIWDDDGDLVGIKCIDEEEEEHDLEYDHKHKRWYDPNDMMPPVTVSFVHEWIPDTPDHQ